MSVSLECKKIKRTGFLPTFIGGGIFTAAVPVVNMAVRSEIYQTKQGNPIQILLGANWQMMSMLNMLLVVTGACLLYHTEYADNAMQKMKSLPIGENSVFLGKVILTIFMSFLALAIEAGAIVFCSYHWFEIGKGFWGRAMQNFGYAFLLMLPCIVLALLISEACKNMWVSLGIGVVCVFTATMLPVKNFGLSLFPFAMPFQIFDNTDMVTVMRYICAAMIELSVFALAELIFVKIRRSFE